MLLSYTQVGESEFCSFLVLPMLPFYMRGVLLGDESVAWCHSRMCHHLPLLWEGCSPESAVRPHLSRGQRDCKTRSLNTALRVTLPTSAFRSPLFSLRPKRLSPSSSFIRAPAASSMPLLTGGQPPPALRVSAWPHRPSTAEAG